MISQSDDYNDDLKYAIKLLLSSGGKRIRPRIILLLGNILKGNKDLLITLAASIELLHTATLCMMISLTGRYYDAAYQPSIQNGLQLPQY
jgi:geranylgeranyl pyrophosphate synthase